MSEPTLKPGYETVFTVIDYYDGPRSGIANFGGTPHYYTAVWDDRKDNYSNLFRLSPCPPALFLLEMEDWNIWRRWELAFRTGKATIESHPALPPERSRHEQIVTMLEVARARDAGEEGTIIREAVFEPIEQPSLPPGVLRPLQVLWKEPNPK